MRGGILSWSVMLAVLLAVSGCGSGREEDPNVAIEAHLEMVAVYFEDFADALATVQDMASANAMAERVRGEFVRRADGMVENMTALEARFGGAELTSMMQSVELPELHQRMGRALERFEGQLMRVDRQPQLHTPAFEAAIMEWGRHMERLEFGHAAGGSTAQPGSPEWCRQMMQKPEAQWTMDEAFMFANRCIG